MIEGEEDDDMTEEDEEETLKIRTVLSMKNVNLPGGEEMMSRDENATFRVEVVLCEILTAIGVFFTMMRGCFRRILSNFWVRARSFHDSRWTGISTRGRCKRKEI